MSTTDAPARPDLSHLDADGRLRIEVAETQGATWVWGNNPCSNDPAAECWRLVKGRGYVGVLTPWGYVPVAGDPLTDPGAWGALMAKELSGWITWVGSDGVTRHRCQWRRNEHARLYSPDAYSLPRAVCLAVLTKYGRDTSPYTEDRAA